VLDAWEADVRKAFLKAYAGATKGSGLYASFEDVAGLLALFELEKVLYELRYEINNRPNWIHVPLAGVLGMLGGQP
jgi:maltose alpha-D-glucosyltransferase/alpha-amylase